MLKKLAAIAVITGCLMGSVHADLIDLTPGGFNGNGPNPYIQLYNDWSTHFFSAHGNPGFRPGWLPDNLYSITGLGTSQVTLSWDTTFDGSFGRYPHFAYLVLTGYDAAGTLWFDLQQVPWPESKIGEATVGINDFVTIPGFDNVFLAGLRPVPDTGSTLALFGAGLIALLLFMKRRILLAGAIGLVLGMSAIAQETGYIIQNYDGTVTIITNRHYEYVPVYVPDNNDRDRCDRDYRFRHRNDWMNDPTALPPLPGE